MEKREFKVVRLEQGRESVWSGHSTLQLARNAARSYRRKNPDTQAWVDHYGYRIDGPGGYIEHVR